MGARHTCSSSLNEICLPLLRDNRGWTIEQWDHAAFRLNQRSLLDGEALTDAGRRLRTDVEAVTDSLALAPLTEALGEQGAEELIELLTPSARAIAVSGELPFPNPMGLPQLGADGIGLRADLRR